MRLKLESAFQPCTVAPGDELYRNGIFVFNVTKLLAHIDANAAAFSIEQVAVGSLGLTASNLDDATVQTADLSRPILLAEIAPGRFNVIDGNHRAERARRDGSKALPAHRVGPEVHVRFLTSIESYRSYIDYWNRKIKIRR